MTNTIEKQMFQYIRENVENYDLRASLALDTIDKYRCPLDFADSGLFNDMLDYMEEFCEDNDLNPDDYDPEELFWMDE